MAWFKRNFGFKEGDYDETRSKFDVATTDSGDVILTSRVNKRQYFVGSFEMPSVSDLRKRLASLRRPDGRDRGATFENIGGDARALHLDPKNHGAVFQVASQFNCLEMVGPGVRPIDGISRYASDRTQGPACAMACPAGTVFRNYFCNGGKGQREKQLNGAKDIGRFLRNPKKNYWKMQNGYLLSSRTGAMSDVAAIIDESPPTREKIVSLLRVGVHWSTEVERSKRLSLDEKPHRVCQVFSSAVPIAYDKKCRASEWASFAECVLCGTFEATLACAAILSVTQRRRVPVYLTQVGGGAFGNRSTWIERALRRSLDLLGSYALDVKLVHYGNAPKAPSNLFVRLEKDWRKRGRGKSGGMY